MKIQTALAFFFNTFGFIMMGANPTLTTSRHDVGWIVFDYNTYPNFL